MVYAENNPDLFSVDCSIVAGQKTFFEDNGSFEILPYSKDSEKRILVWTPITGVVEIYGSKLHTTYCFKIGARMVELSRPRDFDKVSGVGLLVKKDLRNSVPDIETRNLLLENLFGKIDRLKKDLDGELFPGIKKYFK